MGRIKDLIEIIRPVNSLMLGSSIIVGSLVTGGPKILQNPVILIYGFVTGFTLIGASMTINDYMDRDIDAVNEPKRPIPSGRVTPNEALIITFFLSFIGLVTSTLISLKALLIAILGWVIMMLYSILGKKTGFLGNIMVSFCISLPFIYGGVITLNISSAFWFSLIALLTNLGREITKGIIDIEGDKMAGINTIAVRYGSKKAAIVSSIFYLIAVLISLVPYLKKLVSLWYIPFVFITDLGIFYGIFLLLRDPSRETSRKVKTIILYCMIFGLLGFALGSF